MVGLEVTSNDKVKVCEAHECQHCLAYARAHKALFTMPFSRAKQLGHKLRDPRAQRRRTHPRSQHAVILVVTVPLLESRAVVFLLHQPVVHPLPCQAGIDDKTVALDKEARY